MTNPDNVGGLLPCPGCGKSDLDHCPGDFIAVSGLTRGMMVRCAWCHFAAPEAAWNRRELCRAAPAGGDVCATCQGHGMIGWTTGQTPEQFDQHEAPCPDCSAPAGSGEVSCGRYAESRPNMSDCKIADSLDRILSDAISGHVGGIDRDGEDALRRAAALLRKLQQGAE